MRIASGIAFPRRMACCRASSLLARRFCHQMLLRQKGLPTAIKASIASRIALADS